ncbi:MAG: hypothetical protein LUD72_14575, partial [Bacteroidales bacterium]|nr:hypothetical protein [Bacteroidales bacterium]
PEKIFMTIKPDGTYRPDSALSKEQKQILNVFGLDEQYVKKQAQRIGDIYAGRKNESLLTLKPQKKTAPKASE